MRCIVSDLDGTLVKTSMNTVDEETVAYLKRLQQQGVLVVLASGRPLSMMRDVADMLDVNQYGGYLIGHNGYQVEDYKNNTVTEAQVCLSQDVVDFAFNFSSSHLSYLTLTTHAASYNYGYKLVRHIKRLYFYIRLRKTAHGFLREYNDITSLMEVKEPVFKIGFASYSRRALIQLQDAMQLRFGESVEVVRVNSRYLDVTPKGITKGSALQKIMEIEGLTPEDIIAFGDAENDLSMFEVAGTSVAMDNAMEHVKVASDAVTESNMNDGVLKYLYQVYGHFDG